MIEFFETALIYFSGLWALLWILIGFLVTNLLSKIFGYGKIDQILRKVGLVILFLFVPLLVFRIFLDIDFGEKELLFSLISFLILSFMYLFALLLAKKKVQKDKLLFNSQRNFILTIITNQGRSSAFVGGAMLAVSSWQVPAAIYINISAIFIFAIIPFILSRKTRAFKANKIKALPWYLRFFPWYLLIFVITAIILHGTTGLVLNDLGNFGTVFEFFTALTIPAALYYAGSGLQISELSLLIKKPTKKYNDELNEVEWARLIIFISILIIPLIIIPIFGTMFIFGIIPKEWFIVLTINAILPITSINMFLVPYGISKKATAVSVAWTTVICVPIVALLIAVFQTFLI